MTESLFVWCPRMPRGPRGESAPATICLLLGSLCGCAETPDPCSGRDVYIGMPADQALPVLQQCGKLGAEAAGGITSWTFRDRVIGVTPKGVNMIVNLK